MFRQKKSLVLFLAIGALVGCGGNNDSGTIRLKVWGPIAEKPIYEKLAAEFIEANKEQAKIAIQYGRVEESEAATVALGDIDQAGDVFMFADDQLGKLVKKGALAKLTTSAKNRLIERDVADAVDNATYEGDVYGYPVSNDNGYFLYYNNNELTSEDVLTLEGILAKTTDKKKLLINMGDGYFALSGVLHTHELGYNYDTDKHTTTIGDAASISQLAGLSSLLFENTHLLSASLDDQLAEMGKGGIIAAVSGNWNYAELKKEMGDKLSATKLPTYKNDKGEAIQMGSFAGSKLVGVKSTISDDDTARWAFAFAEYITNEAAQRHRLLELGKGPSNKVLNADEELLADELGLKALQMQKPYSISQAKSVGPDYWEAASLVGEFIIKGQASPTSPATLEAVLDSFVATITGTSS